MFGLSDSEYYEFSFLLPMYIGRGATFSENKDYESTSMTMPSDNPSFNKFAVTYCSPNDTYNHVRGKLEVMRKMAKDYYILIPRDTVISITE